MFNFYLFTYQKDIYLLSLRNVVEASRVDFVGVVSCQHRHREEAEGDAHHQAATVVGTQIGRSVKAGGVTWFYLKFGFSMLGHMFNV